MQNVLKIVRLLQQENRKKARDFSHHNSSIAKYFDPCKEYLTVVKY